MKPRPDCSQLISPMSVLDNVENFVIEMLLFCLKTKQVPATRYPLPAKRDQITGRTDRLLEL